MSATELTPEQSALYSQQYEPQHITQVEILGERSSTAIVAAFALLPRIGEIVLLARINGDTDVLEIVGVMHWAVQVQPGQTEFPSNQKRTHFVDATITCRRRSLLELKRKEE